MLRVLRNVAIVALIALVLTVLPAGGNVADGILTALSLLFLGAIALLAVRFWTQNSLSRDAMTDRQRGTIYGSLGAIALMIAGTDELFENPTEPYTRRLIDSIPGGSIELHAG